VGETQSTSRETVRVLAALSDENRFRIVELLATEKAELTCGAIGKALDMSPSLLSHHLGILAEAEIIGRRKNGLWTMNVLQKPVIERQVRTLQSLIRSGGSGNGTHKHAEALIQLHRDAIDADCEPGDEAVAGS
jgi:DNA-binding transcriptional ArsR family regulator